MVKSDERPAVDREGDPVEPGVEAWRRLLTAYLALSAAIDKALRTDHGLSIAEYDVLLQLWRAPEQRARMADLAARALFSKSGLTGLVGRLERAGLVERQENPADRRGVLAVLTDDGAARVRAAKRTQIAAAEAAFAGRFSPADLATLGDLLGRLGPSGTTHDR